MLYAVLAFTAAPAGSLELFPFFNWSLFSSSSPLRSDNVLVVTAVDGEPLASPTLFYDMDETFSAAAARDTALAKTVDRMVYATNSRDADMQARIRGVIESYWLRETGRVSYELRRISYNPIAYYETGEVLSQKTIAKFEKRSGQDARTN